MSTVSLKKFGPLALAALMLTSCDEHASVNVHIDSVGKQRVRNAVDSVGAGLEKVGEKAKELGGRAKDRLDHLAKDSIK